MITAETEAAIAKGLAFLARSQARDGSWRSNAQYGGTYPTAMTALAGLALMAGGNTPVEGPYSANVRQAVDYLLSNSNSNGVIARMESLPLCVIAGMVTEPLPVTVRAVSVRSLATSSPTSSRLTMCRSSSSRRSLSLSWSRTSTARTWTLYVPEGF